MTLYIKLYDRVLSLANSLTEAVERDDDRAFMQQYAELEKLCAEAQAAGTAHPFYLESLGDFTLDDDDAIDIYEQALELLPQADWRAQKPGLMMASIYRTLLREIEADGYQVLHQRVSLTPLRKFWLAWKTQALGRVC